jgi:hypothetical protein
VIVSLIKPNSLCILSLCLCKLRLTCVSLSKKIHSFALEKKLKIVSERLIITIPRIPL